MAQHAPPAEMTLANLGGGALMELAGAELHKICANIADPNMQPDAKRVLTINIVIEPDIKGQSAAISFEVKSKLPGQVAGKTMAHIAFNPEAGAITLFEVESHPPLFPEPTRALPLEVKNA